MEPDIDITNMLSANIASLTSGVNLFATPEMPYDRGIVPHKAVFVHQSGGYAIRPMRIGGTMVQEKHVRVKVIIRGSASGEIGSYKDSKNLALEIYRFLNLNPPANYCDLQCTSSAPMYLGKRELGSHVWSINTIVTFDE